MRSEHREFFGTEYFRHVLPSAVLQPAHAAVVAAAGRTGQPINVVASFPLALGLAGDLGELGVNDRD
jgi:hypothetical protein